MLLAAASFVLAACSEAPAQAPSRQIEDVRVIVEPLRFERTRTRIEAVGTSRARRSAELYPVAAGEVVAVNFTPGQAVLAGDVLVELDSREEKLAVSLARIRLGDAERLYSRYSRSAGSGAVVPSVLDEARSAVEVARLELERAEIALADRAIMAAFDGHVGTTEIDRGDRVGTDTLITTLDDRRSLLVRFDVPESFVGEMAVGDEVRLETWDSRDAAGTGRIVDIGSRIDPQTRTFAARAEVLNEDDALRPGMSFRVAVDVEGESFPVVAETGVQWGADGAYVWSVVDGRADRKPARIVQRREGRVLLDADLDVGDIVVVEGIQRMRDGIGVAYDAPSLVDRARDAVAIDALRRDAAAESD